MNALASYLTARGITVPMPSDIRYLPPKGNEYGAMVSAARDNNGNVVAVQQVYIHEGKKAQIETPKKTNGVLDGAAVRLPGSKGNELVLVEGPETGLSVWQATGWETWIALGSIAKLVDIVPLDRPVIIARDADEPGSQADKALMKAVGEMIERGVSVRVVSPPNPTKTGYDFNDVLMDSGSQAVANALSFDGKIKPRYPAQSGTVQEGRRAVTGAFSSWTGALPTHWQEKAVYSSYQASIAGDQI